MWEEVQLFLSSNMNKTSQGQRRQVQVCLCASGRSDKTARSLYCFVVGCREMHPFNKTLDDAQRQMAKTRDVEKTT